MQGWHFHKITGLFTNYSSQCQGPGRDEQGQTGTRQGQTGTSRDKQGQPIAIPACPYLSLVVLVCPCLSPSVLVCPCLSLSFPVCLTISYTCISPPADNYHSLHQYENSNIDFACKSNCSNACKPSVFFTFNIDSSITLSFNLNSSILVIYFSKGYTLKTQK